MSWKISKAERLFNKGFFDDAIAICEASDDGSARAKYILGSSILFKHYDDTGIEDAIQQYTAAIERDKKYADAYLSRGLARRRFASNLHEEYKNQKSFEIDEMFWNALDNAEKDLMQAAILDPQYNGLVTSQLEIVWDLSKEQKKIRRFV